WEKWNLGMGMHFTRSGEQLGFQSVPATAFDSSGVSGGFGSAPFYTVPGNDTFISYHRDWLDADVQVGYVFFKDIKNELSVFCGVGISSLLSHTEGGSYTSYDAALPVFTVNQNASGEIYRKNNFTGLAGLEYTRNLSTHFGMTAGITGHYYFTQILNR